MDVSALPRHRTIGRAKRSLLLMNVKTESFLRKIPVLQSMVVVAVAVFILLGGSVEAQTCSTASDMDAATRSALENTGKRLFDMASKGDVFNLKQSAIPSLAANFNGIETAVIENKDAFSGATATVRPPFMLKLEGNEPAARAEFLCGVFGPQGQTANSAVFVFTNLPPATYGIDIVDIKGAKGPYTLSLVLQQIGNDWKIAGWRAVPTQVGGHDYKWYSEQAGQYKTKGELHNAWLYNEVARELLSRPVPFMSTLETDRLYDAIQASQPKDAPAETSPLDLSAGNGKTYKITQMFPVLEGDILDLVIKYQYPDVSNTAQTFQDNMAVMRAIVAKYPEFRSAFAAVVARAVQSDGKDYGSLMPMKDIK